jgi:hypothetical protein
MRFQLQRAEDLHQLAAEAVRNRFDDPRHLHGQRGTARDDAAVAQAAGETAQQRVRIHAGVAVEPAVLVGQQRLQVQRRHLLRGGRVAPHAVAVRERAQRRAVARQHHGAAGVGCGQVQREQTVEDEGREQGDDNDEREDAQSTLQTGGPSGWLGIGRCRWPFDFGLRPALRANGVHGAVRPERSSHKRAKSKGMPRCQQTSRVFQKSCRHRSQGSYGSTTVIFAGSTLPIPRTAGRYMSSTSGGGTVYVPGVTARTR